MNKAIVVLVALLTIATVAATVDVDCGHGWWDGDICREHDVQDAFDEQDDRDDDQDDRMDDIEDDVEDLEHDVHHVKHDVRDNEKDIKKLERKDRMQDNAIMFNYMIDGYQSTQIWDLQSEISSNSESWSKDEVGDPGISKRTVKYMIDEYDVMLMARIVEMLTLQNEELMCYIEYGYDAEPRLIRNCQAMKASARTQQEFYFEDGTWCDEHGCIRYIPAE